MKLDFKNFQPIIDSFVQFIKKYFKLFIFIVLIGIFGFIFYRISYFNSLEPTDQELTDKLLTVKRPKIDKTIVEKLEKLESQNIQVQTLFNQARDNPFAE